MSLPKWVEELGNKQYDARESSVTVIEDHRIIYKALAIAWEGIEQALAPLGDSICPSCKCEGCEVERECAMDALKDALRRITELGEGK